MRNFTSITLTARQMPLMFLPTLDLMRACVQQAIDDVSAANGEQTRFQTTFIADEMQLEDMSQLGAQALNLCEDTPIFWIHPVTATTASRSLPETR
jgi:hypothetical protein